MAAAAAAGNVRPSTFTSSSKDIILGALSFPLTRDNDPNQLEPPADGLGDIFDLVHCVLGKGTWSVSGAGSDGTDCGIASVTKPSRWGVGRTSGADFVASVADSDWISSDVVVVVVVSTRSRLTDSPLMDAESLESSWSVEVDSSRSRLRITISLL